MDHSTSTNSSTLYSVEDSINILQEDSELVASSINSVNVDWDNDGTDKIHLHSQLNFMDVFGANDKQTLNQSERKGFRMVYLVALAVLMNALCVGFGAPYTATATIDMTTRASSSVHPTRDEVGWIGSLLAIGALFGGMVAGQLAQSLGRKVLLILNTLPLLSGWMLIAYSHSVGQIYAGRLIIGACCGVITVTAPMYLVEISTPDVRGLLGASFQLFITIGILIVSCLGSKLYWTWLAVAGGIISVFTLLVNVLIPESPRWLMAKGRRKEAEKSIRYLQGNFLDASEECKTIQEEIDDQPKGSFRLRELISPEVYKPALLSFALMFFQQYSGVNAILFYTVEIFERAGSTMSKLATIIIAIVQMVATFVSSILMDRSGRKILLMVSGICMAISLAVFGAFEFIAVGNPSSEKEIRMKYGWLPLTCLMVFISAFSLGFGPIPWLMTAEMSTARFRSVTSAAATALNWTFVFAVTNTFNNMNEAIYDYGTYFTYAGVCAVSCFFTFFLLPETKGKEIEEIKAHFMKKKRKFPDLTSVLVVVVPAEKF